MGLLGTEIFLHPPFLHHRKQASLGLLDRPCLPSAAFKQLLIRAERGRRDVGGAVKGSLGSGSWLAFRGAQHSVFVFQMN